MEKKYPLTKQQEGLWIEWRLHPDNTSYNTCVKLRLTGCFDKDRFEQALHHVVRFFSSLRIYFVEEGSQPFQCIKDKGEFVLEYEDVSVSGQNCETPEQAKKAREFLEKKLRTPVDLKTFPIVRAGLIKTAPEVHYFIGIVPHIVSDGSSAISFLEVSSIAYNEGYEGLEKAYGTQQKDWSDYFEEQGEKCNETVVNEEASYWRQRMEGAQHLVDFSYGQQQARNSSKTGKRIYFDLLPELSQRLKDYSRSQRTTLFSTLVATFGLLIHRYYGQDDILVGYPVNIRPPGHKYLFGFFVNIIPIRIDFSGNPTFDELVSRVSASRKSDKKYQTFPALDIVREIRKSISGFDGRVFNVSMAQTVSRLVNLRLDGVHSEPLEAEYNDVNDDLSLSYELLENGRIGLWIEYREGLLSAELIEQMIAHIQSLLQQVTEAPQKKLNAYALLEEGDEKQFLEEWAYPGDGQTFGDKNKTLHGLIEKCAHKNPDSVALVSRDKEITYDQMNKRANRLAHILQSKDIQKGDRVALSLHRGPEMIYALLAILKAGAAYVPTPPCYPKARLAFILQDAGCKAVITQDELLENFKGIDGPSVISIDDDFSGAKSENLDVKLIGKDPCYIIYTSGSTGQAKGVLLHHGNVVPRILWLQHEIGLNNQDVVLQNTDYSFDVSVAEIFWPLAAGARLILTESGKHKDPSYLIDLVETHKITVSCMVPSLLNSVLAVLNDKSALSSLKYLLAAGEVLPPSLVKTYYKKSAGTLYNIYGPTEAAIYVAFKKCPDQDMLNVPIGRPIGDTALYILDKQQRPQPAGVAGELYIGGSGVAQGYVNQPELTSEKFITDPFSKESSARLYKTGDLARFSGNGDIEYLGRLDTQVKIRGFRIELAEIESILSSYAGIQEVAVIDFGEPGHKRLVAYYVSDEPHEAKNLRAHIAAKVPDYMIPSFFVSIEKIPRLASDKINHRALPNPQNLIRKRSKHVAPSGEVEGKLALIWASILKIPVKKIGVHDSFFDMGGDSLMAIQFVCEAEERGLVFETSTLFEHKTIVELAKFSRDAGTGEDRPDEIIEGVYPLLPRHAKFFADNFSHPNYWNRFFYFDIDHDVNPDHLQQAFDAVLIHHDSLRVSFVNDRQDNYQQKCLLHAPDQPYVFSHDVSDFSGVAQERKIIELCNQYQSSFDLGVAPLIRAVHFKTKNNAGTLAVIAHHMLVDMVSSRIIFEDFLKSYEGLRRGIDLPLAKKTTSAKAWSEYLQALTATENFTEEIAYWGHENMQPRPALKSDFENIQKADEGSAALKKIIMSPEDTAILLQDIQSRYSIGIQEFLLACLLQTTKSHTGDDHLVVNICGHGRDGAPGINLSRTVAWANTVFPVHLKIGNEEAFDFIQNVKEQINAVPCKNEYYNLLRYSMEHPEITKYRTPEIFFNYVSQIDAIMPDGVSFQPVPEPAGIVSSSPDNHLCYLLYMEAAIIDKCLNIHITYSKSSFRPETIFEFAHTFEVNIKNTLAELNDEQEILLIAE